MEEKSEKSDSNVASLFYRSEQTMIGAERRRLKEFYERIRTNLSGL